MRIKTGIQSLLKGDKRWMITLLYFCQGFVLSNFAIRLYKILQFGVRVAEIVYHQASNYQLRNSDKNSS